MTIRHDNPKMMDLVEHQLKTEDVPYTRTGDVVEVATEYEMWADAAFADDEFQAALILCSKGFEVRPKGK